MSECCVMVQLDPAKGFQVTCACAAREGRNATVGMEGNAWTPASLEKALSQENLKCRLGPPPYDATVVREEGRTPLWQLRPKQQASPAVPQFNDSTKAGESFD